MRRMTPHPLSAITGLLVILTVLNQSNLTDVVLFNGGCKAYPDFCVCIPGKVVCNCSSEDELILDEQFSQLVEIDVRGCKNVSIPRGSFRTSNNLALTLSHIQDIHLVFGSFERDAQTDIRINITILDSTIREIPRGTFSITGSSNLRQPVVPFLALHIANSQVHKMAKGALGNFFLQAFSLVNSILHFVETQALDNNLTGKITLLNNTFRILQHKAIILHNVSQDGMILMLQGNKFEGNVPQFLVGSLVGDVYITNNTFPPLETSPWNLRVDGDVKIGHNVFNNIPKNGIHLSATGQIHLRDNDIHHLQAHAFQLIMPIGKKAIIFLEYNIIRQHDPRSLCLHPAFDARTVVIKHTLFQQKCSCNITADIATALGVPNITLEALYRDGVHEQWFRGGECLSGEQWKVEVLQDRTATSPLPPRRVPIDQYLVHSCLDTRSIQTVLLIVFAVILVTIAVCVILAWRRVKQRTTLTSSSNSDYHNYTEPVPPSSSSGQPWLLVQPDPRTYQETEIHILFDKAEELDAPKEDKTETNLRERGDGSEGDHQDGTENKAYDGKEGRVKSTVNMPPTVRQSCPPLSLSHEK